MDSDGSGNLLKDSILNYAINLRERTAHEFDQTNATRLNQTLSDMNKIITLKLISVIQGCDIGTGARFDAFALTKSSMDILVSALQMARQRAVMETLSLLRVALEAACTAHHIYKDQDAYTQYLAGRYKSTTSITYLKREIPIIGKVWGAFSNTCVHTNHTFFGPQFVKDEEDDNVPIVSIDCQARSPKAGQDTILLTFISLVATILLKVLEDTITDDRSDLPPSVVPIIIRVPQLHFPLQVS